MNREPIKELTLKAPDGREKQVLASLPTEQTEKNFRKATERKGIEVIKKEE